MPTAHWTDALRDKGACDEAIAFGRQYATFSDAWAACTRAEWMLWWLGRTRTTQADAHMYARIAIRCVLAIPDRRTLPGWDEWATRYLASVETDTAEKAGWTAMRTAAAGAAAAAAAAAATGAAAWVGASGDAPRLGEVARAAEAAWGAAGAATWAAVAAANGAVDAVAEAVWLASWVAGVAGTQGVAHIVREYYPSV